MIKLEPSVRTPHAPGPFKYLLLNHVDGRGSCDEYVYSSTAEVNDHVLYVSEIETGLGTCRRTHSNKNAAIFLVASFASTLGILNYAESRRYCTELNC